MIENEGAKVCESIRTEAKKTALKLELLREKVKAATWDKMEVANRAVKSLKGETKLFNYTVRKLTDAE